MPNAQSKPKRLFHFLGFWKHISQQLIYICKYWILYKHKLVLFNWDMVSLSPAIFILISWLFHGFLEECCWALGEASEEWHKSRLSLYSFNSKQQVLKKKEKEKQAPYLCGGVVGSDQVRPKAHWASFAPVLYRTKFLAFPSFYTYMLWGGQPGSTSSQACTPSRWT